MAGAITLASDSLPYFRSAWTMPATDPGTLMALYPMMLASAHHFALCIEIHIGGCGCRSFFAVVKEMGGAIGHANQHEPATAEVSRLRITTASTKPVATAASTALPPDCMISTPCT